MQSVCQCRRDRIGGDFGTGTDEKLKGLKCYKGSASIIFRLARLAIPAIPNVIAMSQIDQPEPRWQVLLALLAVTGIYMALPKRPISNPPSLLQKTNVRTTGLMLICLWCLRFGS